MIKVLIVEDKKGISETMTALLEASNMKVIAHVGLGKEALQILKGKKPDVMILDLLLPDMDGNELYQKIKMIYPELKVILITSLPERRAEEMVGKEKVHKIVYKPFSIDLLIDKINQVVGKKG